MTTEDKILKTLEDIKRVTLLGVKDVLDVKDVAAITGLSVNRIQHLVNDRAIPCYKPPGRNRLFFKKSEINAWMLQGRQDSITDVMSAATTQVVLDRVKNGRRHYRGEAAQGDRVV